MGKPGRDRVGVGFELVFCCDESSVLHARSSLCSFQLLGVTAHLCVSVTGGLGVFAPSDGPRSLGYWTASRSVCSSVQSLGEQWEPRLLG